MNAARSTMLEFDPSRAKATESLVSLLPEQPDPFLPPFPASKEALGVSAGFLTDLALKTVSADSDCTTAKVAAKMHLPTVVTDQFLQQLCRENQIEMKGVVGLHNHRFAMLDRGWESVARLLASNSYVGPAPVSLQAYTDAITRQVHSRPPIPQHVLDASMKELVLSPAAKQTLGLVASSGRSLFISGPPGNGKTAMARALVNAIPNHIWIPYAIEVDGQAIQVFDSHNHQPLDPPAAEHDRRWLRIRPPLIVVGGELTIANLDLMTTDTHGFYEAPVQMKANGGVLVVDDLGRQRCSATELLNRWIIPLEHRIDFLTLNTGKKIRVPFEQIVIFATNLTTEDLADEAFLRRMGYRLYVMAPAPDTYASIFSAYAHSKGLSVEPSLLAHLETRYNREHREPKACEPRDLIDRAIEACKYNRESIRLTPEMIDIAWNSYFGASVSG